MILVVQFCGRAVGVVQQQGERQRRSRTLYARGFAFEKKRRDGSAVASESDGKAKSTREREQVQERASEPARVGA